MRSLSCRLPHPCSDVSFGHIHLLRGRRSFTRPAVNTPSPTHLLADTGCDAHRQGASKRRKRDKEHARTAIDRRFERQIADLTNKHQYVLTLLRKEEGRRRIAVAEHHSLTVEIEKYRSLDKGEVEQVELRRAAAVSAAERANQEAIVQLKTSHDLVIQDLINRHTTAQEAAKLELRRLRADVARLRAERDARTADSLRYNADRNALAEQLLALRTQRSKATVAACIAAPCFPPN